MAKSYQELMDMAVECRELASVAKTPDVREQLLRLADQFERLAAGTSKRRPKNGEKVSC